MSGPQSFDPTNVAYFDGEVPHPVALSRLRLTDDTLELTLADGTQIFWPSNDVRAVTDVPGRTDAVLRLTFDPVARLFMPDLKLVKALPRPYRRAPVKGRARLAAWALGAIAAVAIQIFVLIPLLADQMAEVIPQKGERALGEATLGQIQSILAETGADPIAACSSPEGDQALAAMQDALVEHIPTLPETTLLVLDHEMINAFALPGGYVALFRGLLEAAETPEEVIAVYAHELGHVISRDPTRNALRSAGSIGVLGLLFGDFAGGLVVLFLAERLIDAQYVQDAESAADAFAADLLPKAGVSPDALATFFERLHEEHGDSEGIVQHFQSHPALGDRIEAAKNAVPEDFVRKEILTPQAWAALQKICG